MGKIKACRVIASTILETVVALVIIMTIVGIATTIFVRTSATLPTMQRLKAENVMKSYAERSQREREFFDDYEVIDSFAVKREVASAPRINNLWQMHFYVYNKDSVLLCDSRYLFIAN